MSDQIIKATKFTTSQMATFHVTEDHLLFECINRNDYSGIIPWKKISLIEFEGEMTFKLLLADRKNYSYVLALSNDSDEFFNSIEDKVARKSKKRIVGEHKKGHRLEDGSILYGYLYNAMYIIFIKKEIGKRTLGDLEFDYPFIRTEPPISTLIDKKIKHLGRTEIDIKEINSKFKGEKKKNKRKSYLYAVLLIVTMLIIFYLTRDIISRNGEPYPF